MTKDDIRRRVKARKALLNDAEKESAARRAFDRLEDTADFMMAEHILMYHSLPDELSTHAFLDKWKDRKHFYLPRVNGVNLDILPYEQTHLALGSFHIEEPVGDDTTTVDRIELIIIPGVAYDRKCSRLGRGKGFYDRLLHDSHARKIGMAYDFQIVNEDIPVEEHDVPVDMVITELRIIKH